MDSGNEKHINNNNLPIGKYTLIGIDVDTTGRRLIDEIVQLAAYYNPEKQYSQYIMPYMNLNPAARQRHQVRVITVGFYRMLKCMQTFKVLKSKSEVAALKDFLEWIEDIKNNDDNSLGVILIHHEQRKFIPYILLEAFKKYGMLDRFFKTVKSFSNGFMLAEEKCTGTVKNFSLRQLSRAFLNSNKNSNINNNNIDNNCNDGDINNMNRDKDNFEGNARVRAKLAYQIVYHIAKDDLQKQQQNNLDTREIIDNMIKLIIKYTNHIENDVTELSIQNKNVERQNSFRPIFLQYFKATLYHRVKAVKFRIILAEKGYDYEVLKKIWYDKHKDGLIDIIQTIDTLKNDEKNELIQILDCHFDPVKQSFKPTIRRSRRRRIRNNRNKENVSPRGGDGDNVNINNHNDSKLRSPARRIDKRSRTRFTKKPLTSFSS